MNPQKTFATARTDWLSGRKLISLLEMIHYPIKKYIMAEFAVDLQCKTFCNASNPLEQVDQTHKDSLIFDFNEVWAECNFLGLGSSVMLIEQIVSNMKNTQAASHYSDVATQLILLRQIMWKEMDERKFAFIPADKAEFFERDDLFGKEVNERFLSIISEIKDAGNCIAAGLNTAAVIHSMRVMEYGLHRLHRRLRLPKPRDPNWSVFLREVEAEIVRRDKLPHRPPQWRKQREFYVEAAQHFRFFKDKRNQSVHIEYAITDYVPPGDETAQRIFNEVKHFMQHLATKLKE